jgi:hypothetical protein
MATKEKTRAQYMREFTEMMIKVYDLAEGLRDAADGNEKDIFNKTRGALSDLQYPALELTRKWEAQEQKTGR